MAPMHLLRRWIHRLVDACTLRVVADDGTPLVIVCDPHGVGVVTLAADEPGYWDLPELTDAEWYRVDRADW